MPSYISLALFFFAIAIATAMAKEYEVGGHVGWRIPASNETELYNVWASRRSFHVGDSLRFRYSTESVVMVDKFGYYHCDSTHPIAYFNDGNTLVKLDKLGTVYFISGNWERCIKGQSMLLDVVDVHQHHRHRHLPASIAYAPQNPYYDMSPSPSQVAGGSGTSDSGSLLLAHASFKAFLGAALVLVIIYSY
uniref:stellacyanin-like n=1 Tax=Erigeron canadensis TaxID=72917 RepID=UPI001CB8ADB7|nr:stellacyanin-like [Erigeron canadensis]